MGGGFYTVYALSTWAAPPAQAGVFTTLLLAGQIAGNVTLGWLADRMGHRLVIVAGGAAMIGANPLALGASSLGAFGVVFVLAGVPGAAGPLPEPRGGPPGAPPPQGGPAYLWPPTTLSGPPGG